MKNGRVKPRLKVETTQKVIAEMQERIAEYTKVLESGERYHITTNDGNSKTGINCRTVSLASIIDCQNCSACAGDCYDFHNVLNRIKEVKNDRARNSALHKFNRDWYWEDVEADIKRKFIMELRINVGGDLEYEDFVRVGVIAERNPKCSILFFTKNYDDLNKWLDERNGEYPSNLHPMWSRWIGLEGDNKWKIPESHILFQNGETTAPEFGAYFCSGNCSECHFNETGCPSLKRGEHVIFEYH